MMKLNLLLMALAFLSACQNVNEKKDTSDNSRTAFFDKSGMDTTVKPGDNFFLYANGKWIKQTQIPETETDWGSFNTLSVDNITKLNEILIRVSAQKHPEGSLEQKVGDFYASGIDTLTIEKLGSKPLSATLAKIDAIKDYKELLDFVSGSFKEGDGYLFGFRVGPDDKISSKNAVNFFQSGVTLPDKTYYLNNDEQTLKVRHEFLKYMNRVLVLTGSSREKASESATQILKLETRIARSHSDQVALRDPQKNYNKYLVAEFQKMTPAINWEKVLTNMGLKTDTILVGQPEYYKSLSKLVASQPIAIWKEKLKFDAINGSAGALSKDFRNAAFDFFGKTLQGQQLPVPRWRTIVNSTDGYMGELLGQLYVKEHFTPEAKERMLELVDNLQKAYQARMEKIDWMSSDTKNRAIDKLRSIIKKIGYPDKWEDYQGMNIRRDSYYNNLQSAAKYSYKRMIDKLGKPVDKTEWHMTPPTVNAYYNPTVNEIVFPAGILQFPFFDQQADDAINYGAIGAVIGHEMTHGFDDQGRQYDKNGDLKDWWTAEDASKFKVRTDKVVSLYNSFTLLDNQHVNGELTLGENLADIGGLAIAYDAFKLTSQGKGTEKIDGFTPDQRFFLSLAQVWRTKSRDESMRVRLKTDPHSPEMFRVNGSVYNMEAFYKAFNVPSTAKMYVAPADRIKIW
ncbi:M13 family metallopeptidase [Pedobacter deserti]|uniref:M13 family metallopeptidase n=1 Tax=Pedobacter deserti TaxID=2817382 RepID=UPI00210A602C|nr:M13 family metallopeptidase [Pedobacter sp. SYSU D00382]